MALLHQTGLNDDLAGGRLGVTLQARVTKWNSVTQATHRTTVGRGRPASGGKLNSSHEGPPVSE